MTLKTYLGIRFSRGPLLHLPITVDSIAVPVPDFIQFLFTDHSIDKKLVVLVGEDKEQDGTNCEEVVFQVCTGGEHTFLNASTADQQEDEQSVRKPEIICFINLSMLSFNLEERFSQMTLWRSWMLTSGLRATASRVTSVKSSIGIITHQGHISQVSAND